MPLSCYRIVLEKGTIPNRTVANENSQRDISSRQMEKWQMASTTNKPRDKYQESAFRTDSPTRTELHKHRIRLEARNFGCKCTRSQSNFRWKLYYPKVQVRNEQEKAQSERNSHSKNQGGKN